MTLIDNHYNRYLRTSHAQKTRRKPRCHSLVPIHGFQSWLRREYLEECLLKEVYNKVVMDLVLLVKSTFRLYLEGGFCCLRSGDQEFLENNASFFITRMSSYRESLGANSPINFFGASAFMPPTSFYNIHSNNHW